MAGDDNNREVQMLNTKYQLKSQFLMPNVELCYLDFSIDLSFGYWNLSLNRNTLSPIKPFD